MTERTKRQQQGLAYRLREACERRRLAFTWQPDNWQRLPGHLHPVPVGPFVVTIWAVETPTVIRYTSKEHADRYDAIDEALQHLRTSHPLKPGAPNGNRNGSGNRGKTRAVRNAAIAAALRESRDAF